MKSHMSTGTAASQRGSACPAFNPLLVDSILRVSLIVCFHLIPTSFQRHFLSFDSGPLRLVTPTIAPPRLSGLLAPTQ